MRLLRLVRVVKLWKRKRDHQRRMADLQRIANIRRDTLVASGVSERQRTQAAVLREQHAAILAMHMRDARRSCCAKATDRLLGSRRGSVAPARAAGGVRRRTTQVGTMQTQRRRALSSTASDRRAGVLATIASRVTDFGQSFKVRDDSAEK